MRGEARDPDEYNAPTHGHCQQQRDCQVEHWHAGHKDACTNNVKKTKQEKKKPNKKHLYTLQSLRKPL